MKPMHYTAAAVLAGLAFAAGFLVGRVQGPRYQSAEFYGVPARLDLRTGRMDAMTPAGWIEVKRTPAPAGTP